MSAYIDDLLSIKFVIEDINSHIFVPRHQHKYIINDITDLVAVKRDIGSIHVAGEVCWKCGHIREVSIANIPCHQLPPQRNNEVRYIDNISNSVVKIYICDQSHQHRQAMPYFIRYEVDPSRRLIKFIFCVIIRCVDCEHSTNINLCNFIVNTTDNELVSDIVRRIQAYVEQYQPIPMNEHVEFNSSASHICQAWNDNHEHTTNLVINHIHSMFEHYEDERFKLKANYIPASHTFNVIDK